ncbi:MAG: hypothetical protein V8Q39_09655 [Anaerovoracaceae bacterium]
MKKSNFIALILGTIGGIFFALGMCTALLPEWGMSGQGIAAGIAGLLLLLLDLIIWRRMEGKAPVKLSKKTVAAVAVSIFGALLLGIGMCLTMLLGKMVLGIVIGLAGIILLLMLIPLVKGIHG